MEPEDARSLKLWAKDRGRSVSEIACIGISQVLTAEGTPWPESEVLPAKPTRKTSRPKSKTSSDDAGAVGSSGDKQSGGDESPRSGSGRSPSSDATRSPRVEIESVEEDGADSRRSEEVPVSERVKAANIDWPGRTELDVLALEDRILAALPLNGYPSEVELIVEYLQIPTVGVKACLEDHAAAGRCGHDGKCYWRLGVEDD